MELSDALGLPPPEGFPEGRCEICGQRLEIFWRVTIGNADGYRPVMPPGTRDYARCDSCSASFEHFDGEWRRQP